MLTPAQRKVMLTSQYLFIRVGLRWPEDHRIKCNAFIYDWHACGYVTVWPRRCETSEQCFEGFYALAADGQLELKVIRFGEPPRFINARGRVCDNPLLGCVEDNIRQWLFPTEQESDRARA